MFENPSPVFRQAEQCGGIKPNNMIPTLVSLTVYHCIRYIYWFLSVTSHYINYFILFQATQLLSDIGGSVGLCLGVSLLCLVELIEVILEIFEELFRKISKRFKSAIHDVETVQSDTQV